jgi:hypothetical protein
MELFFFAFRLSTAGACVRDLETMKSTTTLGWNWKEPRSPQQDIKNRNFYCARNGLLFEELFSIQRGVAGSCLRDINSKMNMHQGDWERGDAPTRGLSAKARDGILKFMIRCLFREGKTLHSLDDKSGEEFLLPQRAMPYGA